MDDNTKLLMELSNTMAVLCTDVKYLRQTIDELKEELKNVKNESESKCESCSVRKDLDKHIEDTKDNKRYHWKWLVFGVSTLLSLAALAVAIF